MSEIAKADSNLEKTIKNTNGYIVGIGASAGGLEALQQLLSVLPSNTGFPYIVVQHLSPDYKSLLAEILTKYTDMPVLQADNETIIEPDTVYLIPPKNDMRLQEGRLMLTEQSDGALSHPIDIFFRSLAKDAGSRAIAVILSGTGSDGTNGIKDIKEQDGLILVQKADSAKFDGMPKSALRTGLVDAELTPEEIAREMQHISSNNQTVIHQTRNANHIDEALMKRIYYILQKISNVNFTYYKQTTILRRIERRMVLTHKETLWSYVDYLYENPDEVRILSKEVLIGVTNFFRDPEYFDMLKETAVKDILRRSPADGTVRIWVAGCSTGEEAYSIAILFCEAMDELKIRRDIKIFATDLDVESISTAGKGEYGESICECLSSYRLSRFFTRKNNSYIISRDIRKMIVFSPHNVFQDPPFSKLDLICCRNMLIYFQPILQRDLFSVFHVALLDEGYLFLGKSEAIGEYSTVFNVIDANAKIFKHNVEGHAPQAKSVPFMRVSSNSEDDAMLESEYFRSARSHDTDDGTEPIDLDVIDTALLESFMPTCIVVNDRNEIVHTFGSNGNFLHFSIGKASLNLFSTITEDLKIAVSTILKEVRKERKLVGYKDVHVKGEQSDNIVNLSAMPISRKNSEVLVALIISQISNAGIPDDAKPYEIDLASSQRITDLEQELKDTQEKLRSSIAEQDTVNEELQAANEELLTANEELQSSNEELQSVNEELYTVNSEYQQKLAETADMNDDIANFLSTTLIGIMFVDNELNIRRFTNYLSTEFGVMVHDVGRSLKFIAYNFIETDLVEICANVLKTLAPEEREVITTNQKAYFLRVAPYRTAENKILGCVITLVDLSAQKAEQKLLKNANVALNLAQQANSAKSDFLSRMSHEIRTPMNAITGMIEIAKKKSEDHGVVDDCLEKIYRAVDYMNSIVSDILEMSKIEQARIELEYKPFSINTIIENLHVMLDGRAQEQNITLNIQKPEGCSPLYFGDETRVQQILINFLTNGLKYTNAGGTVTLSTKEVDNVKDRAKLCFVVSDTGIGIKKEFLPELFKPFTRENQGKATESSSIGLGLSIAQNLITLMNGYVEVESEVGVGSTFTINITLDTLNSNDSVMVLKGGNEVITDYGVKGLHAMVAEDNEMNRDVLKSILEEQGVRVTLVNDGVEAVSAFNLAEPNTFDCILMDVRMPRMDGREAAKRIRESDHEDAKTIPIIGVSADAFAEDIHKSRAVGIDDYIVKPVDTKKLFFTIRKLCCVEAPPKKK